MSSIRRGHANLLCIDPILVYVLRGKLEITGPLEVSVHLASLQALTKVVGNWARVKTWHANLMQKGAWPLHLKKQEVAGAGKARKTKRVSEADWVSAAGS